MGGGQWERRAPRVVGRRRVRRRDRRGDRRADRRAGQGSLPVALGISLLLAATAATVDPGIARYWSHRLTTAQTVPLAVPVDDGRASYHVSRRDLDGEPITWDHCRPIEWQVDVTGAPDGWRAMVRDAVAEVSAVSGFTFRYRGRTRDRTFVGRLVGPGTDQPPVLIAWATPAEVPELAGEVAGLGGSEILTVRHRQRRLTGSIVLDAGQYAALAAAGRVTSERLMLEHELGHVLGLRHAADTGEVMNPAYVGQSDLGPGDRRGLRRLHDVACR